MARSYEEIVRDLIGNQGMEMIRLTRELEFAEDRIKELEAQLRAGKNADSAPASTV